MLVESLKALPPALREPTLLTHGSTRNSMAGASVITWLERALPTLGRLPYS